MFTKLYIRSSAEVDQGQQGKPEIKISILPEEIRQNQTKTRVVICVQRIRPWFSYPCKIFYKYRKQCTDKSKTSVNSRRIETNRKIKDIKNVKK